MARKVLTAVLALIMCFGINVTAWAAGSTVTYNPKRLPALSVTITNVTAQSETDDINKIPLLLDLNESEDYPGYWKGTKSPRNSDSTSGYSSLRFITDDARFTIYEATSPVKIELTEYPDFYSLVWNIVSKSGAQHRITINGYEQITGSDFTYFDFDADLNLVTETVTGAVGPHTQLAKGNYITISTPGTYYIAVAETAPSSGPSGDLGWARADAGFILVINESDSGDVSTQSAAPVQQAQQPSPTPKPTTAPQSTPTPQPTPTPTPQSVVVTQPTPAPVVISSGYIATTDVNVRASASANATANGYIPRGTAVSVIDNTGNWYKVQFGDKTGYVSAAFVVNQSAMKIANTTPKTVNTAALNVRSGAGVSHSIIGVLKDGDTAYVMEVTNGWAKISWYGGEAYVHNSYLK